MPKLCKTYLLKIRVAQWRQARMAKKSRGRPKGKHSDPNYPKVTLYLDRETTIEVKRRLGDLDKSMSNLVQELLEEWLASNPDTSE